MSAPRALGLTLRLAAYYAVLAAAAVLLARWLPAAPDLSPGGLDELARPRPPGPTPAASPFGRPGGAGGALVSTLGALALVAPVAWVYMRTKPRARYDPSLVHTLIILPVVIAGVVLVVRDSLALAFSLAGIVAAVRFRNTLRDTKDAVYIFLAIGVGIAAGVQAFAVAFVVSVVYVAIVLALWRFDVGATPAAGGGGRVRGLLVAETAAPAAAQPAIAEALDREARRWKLLRSEATAAGHTVLAYAIQLRRRGSSEQLLAAVRGGAAAHVTAVRFEPDSR